MAKVVLSVVLVTRDMERHHARSLVKNACRLFAHRRAEATLWTEAVWECKAATFCRAPLELFVNKVLCTIFIVYLITRLLILCPNQCSVSP